MKKSLFLFLLINVSLTVQAVAQVEAEKVPVEAYERAEQMLSWNLEQKVYRSEINPSWIDETRFWYLVKTRRGTEYMLVNAENRTKDHAFSHLKLANALEEQTGAKTGAWSLSLSELNFSTDLKRVSFLYKGTTWNCQIDKDYFCEALQPIAQPSGSIISPDGKWAAFIKDYNLWVRDLESGKDIQLTRDGIKYFGYATHNDGWRRSDRPVMVWSPDSKKIATYQLDERGVGKTVLWKTKEGRPEADMWPYAIPGDSVVPMMERVIIHIGAKSATWLKTTPDHQRFSNCCGSTRNGKWADVRWSPDSEKLAFVSVSRDYKEATLKIADAGSGEVRTVFSERDQYFFESNLHYLHEPNWKVLGESNEFIWFSRRDNWGHLYLYDLESGELKNQVTRGEWNVIDLLHIDDENRILYFTGVGREKGQDPYQENLYRVNFDGTGLQLLTSEKADHRVFLSREADYFIDSWSGFQSPDTAVLKDMEGRRLLEIEAADVKDLQEMGWKAPKPFTVKARDGKTDIYGIMLLPSDFNPDKKYPVINRIYPGPQLGSIRTRSFSPGRSGEAQALAELGFVVVLIDGMGSPFRSKEFHTAWYGNMADNGLPDQIAGMKQLADQYEFIDLDRAGIYGHSGGGFATVAALTQYPAFFKVGVASAGNHDNAGYTYYWGEKYQGLMKPTKEGDNYDSQANHLRVENLVGNLLITYGTLDGNVHPNMTLLVVNELIKHNKDFEMIAFPNRKHGYSDEPYHIRRSWDYFVEHLLGKVPPEMYEVNR